MRRKILLIRFSSIGDIVLTSPVIRCVHEQLGAAVHVLTKTAFAPMVAAHPMVEKVLALGQPQSQFPTKIQAAPQMAQLLQWAKAEQYDFVLDLHHNLRSLRVKLALGVPTAAFDKLNVEKWLLVNLGINRLPQKHIVMRYMETAAALGVQYDGKGLDFYYPAGSLGSIDQKLTETLPQLANQPYVAFVIGATHATKRLPEDKIVAICQQIPHTVVLVGGPDEAPTGERAAQKAGAHVLNACGRLSLFESARVVEQARQVLTHDTGLMHIAAAFGRPIVSIWGSTVPEFGMYPFYPDGLQRNHSEAVNGLSCRPCSKIGYDKCPKGHFKCMNEQDVSAIVSHFQSFG